MKRTVWLLWLALLLGGCDETSFADGEDVTGDLFATQGDAMFPDSVSLDTEFTPGDDSGESPEECIPTIPEGTLVSCDGYYGIYEIRWDTELCTASIWTLDGDPPPIAQNLPSFVLANGSEEYGFGPCVPADE